MIGLANTLEQALADRVDKGEEWRGVYVFL